MGIIVSLLSVTSHRTWLIAAVIPESGIHGRHGPGGFRNGEFIKYARWITSLTE